MTPSTDAGRVAGLVGLLFGLAGMGSAAAAMALAPLADYPPGTPLTGQAAAVQLAVDLEESAAAAARYLIFVAASAPAAPSGSTAPDLAALRSTTLLALSDAAVRATRWRAVLTPDQATVAFPGM